MDITILLFTSFLIPEHFATKVNRKANESDFLFGEEIFKEEEGQTTIETPFEITEYNLVEIRESSRKETAQSLATSGQPIIPSEQGVATSGPRPTTLKKPYTVPIKITWFLPDGLHSFEGIQVIESELHPTLEVYYGEFWLACVRVGLSIDCENVMCYNGTSAKNIEMILINPKQFSSMSTMSTMGNDNFLPQENSFLIVLFKKCDQSLDPCNLLKILALKAKSVAVLIVNASEFYCNDSYFEGYILPILLYPHLLMITH